MFDIGKNYTVVTLEGGTNYDGEWCTSETSREYECIAIDGTLIKFRTPYIAPDEGMEEYFPAMEREDIIINTSSMFFHSAALVKPEEKAA